MLRPERDFLQGFPEKLLHAQPLCAGVAHRYTASTMPTASKKKTTPAVSSFEPRVDVHINKAPAFAKPILEHLRELVHAAEPDAVEEIKWSRPFFTLHGENLAFMSAFKAHCAFGFWSPSMAAHLESQGVAKVEGAGNFGPIKSLKDLPSAAKMKKFIQYAATLIRSGAAATPMAHAGKRTARTEIPMPADFDALLAQSKQAKTNYEAFPPSCKREYLEWITSAKRPETRERRMHDAIAKITANTRFNDQYRSK